jgi:3-dehydroquinate synthase
MTIVPVSLGNRSYDIVIETGCIAKIGDLVKPFIRGERAIIITDANVHLALKDGVTAGLAKAGLHPEYIVLPAGESTKNWSQLEALVDHLLALGVERSDHLIALGGGVIGDLVGFAASMVKRGCGFIQVPTSLLAQVDSSVGGKTAINTKAGKNLVGQFYQPSLVIIDPEVLDSLPAREMGAGYAEVVKYGLLGDFEFFEWCEANSTALLAGNREAQIYAISKSVQAKAAIVAADERETEDKRALLNLGHTFGHALEADTGFSDKLLHGEAVAAGMALAFGFAATKGLCAGQEAERVSAHLKSAGLPYGLRSAHVSASGEALVAHMLHDKKMSGGVLPFILPHAIGDARVERGVALSDVAAYLDSVAAAE